MKCNTTPTHFLLVEDDDDHAELVKYSMQTNGGLSSVDRVCNGMEALAYLKKNPPFDDAKRPDVILLDRIL